MTPRITNYFIKLTQWLWYEYPVNCLKCTLQHLEDTDAPMKTIIKLWLLFPGCSSENNNHHAILSLGMNQRSLASSGQWRRAVHLTLVSLVQPSIFPVATHCSCLAASQQDAELITHTAYTKRQRVHRHQNIQQRRKQTATHCGFSLRVYTCTHIFLCVCAWVCVWDEEIQKLEADWHSWLCTNIPVMLRCLVHCPRATKQNSIWKTQASVICPFYWKISSDSN